VGREPVNAELHSQRQRRNPTLAQASCAFCQLIPAITLSQQTTPPLNLFTHRQTFGARRRLTLRPTQHRSHYQQATMAPKTPQVSQGTIDQKKKSRAIIAALYPQFEENGTLQTTCLSRDALIHMDRLCTEIQQRHSEQSLEDRWSHVINFLNDTLVKRIESRVGARELPAAIPTAMYNLKSDDFRDAHKSAKLHTVNLASLCATARELDLVENSDGILVQRLATPPPEKAQPIRNTSSNSSTTNQRLPRRDGNAPCRPSSTPSGSIAVPESQRKNRFNVLRYSDLTIILSDRLVHVHRVVLCSASAHFDSLLEDSHPVC